VKAITPANKGDKNQLSTTVPNYYQLIQSFAATAIPAPIKAPTIVCEPLIGIPSSEDVIINSTDEKQVPNIIFV